MSLSRVTLNEVIWSVPCKKHNSEKGEPCFELGGRSRGICQKRLRSVLTVEFAKPISKINHGFRGSKKRK